GARDDRRARETRLVERQVQRRDPRSAAAFRPQRGPVARREGEVVQRAAHADDFAADATGAVGPAAFARGLAWAFDAVCWREEGSSSSSRGGATGGEVGAGSGGRRGGRAPAGFKATVCAAGCRWPDISALPEAATKNSSAMLPAATRPRRRRG